MTTTYIDTKNLLFVVGKEVLRRIRNEQFPFKRKVLFNWKSLKEDITPEEIIDPLRSAELVNDGDLLDRNKHRSKRSQIYCILRNVVDRIQSSTELDEFEDIVHQHCHRLELLSPDDPIGFVNGKSVHVFECRSNHEFRLNVRTYCRLDNNIFVSKCIVYAINIKISI